MQYLDSLDEESELNRITMCLHVDSGERFRKTELRVIWLAVSDLSRSDHFREISITYSLSILIM
jgi:hypothetical protein